MNKKELRTERLYMRATKRTKKLLVKIAKDEKRTITEVVERALEAYVNNTF